MIVTRGLSLVKCLARSCFLMFLVGWMAVEGAWAAEVTTYKIQTTRAYRPTRPAVVHQVRRVQTTQKAPAPQSATRPRPRKAVTRRRVQPFSEWLHEDEHVRFGAGADLRVADDEDKGRAVLEIKNHAHHGSELKVKLHPGQSIAWTDVEGRYFFITVVDIHDHADRVWLRIEPLR